jgi:hypothetical protein
MIESTNNTSAPVSFEKGSSARKLYHAPKLKRYGTVRELTLANASFNPTPDGGAFPNVYAS